MTRPKPDEVKRAAVIGCGTIGAGWAALFLARGIEVVASDPALEAEARLLAAEEAIAGGRGIAELEAARDRDLVAIRKAIGKAQD